VRTIALAIALSVSGLAASQTTQITVPSPEQVINQTFANLNARPDVAFTVTGTEQAGTRVIPTQLYVVWHRTGTGDNRTLKLTAQRRINGIVTYEIKANGNSLYTYDFVNRTYTATAYQKSPDPRQPNLRDSAYHSRMLAALVRATSSTGADSFVARLLQEAMDDPIVTTMGDPVHYRSWMPGRSPQEFIATLPPTTYPDPVVPNKTRPAPFEYGYTPDERNRYFLYDSRPSRSLVFQVYQPETNSPPQDLLLYRIFFGNFTRTATKDRLNEWTMTLSYPAVNAGDATYESQFAPYTDMRGWRPLVSPGASRG
jgi:hypothetical protein